MYSMDNDNNSLIVPFDNRIGLNSNIEDQCFLLDDQVIPLLDSKKQVNYKKIFPCAFLTCF